MALLIKVTAVTGHLIGTLSLAIRFQVCAARNGRLTSGSPWQVQFLKPHSYRINKKGKHHNNKFIFLLLKAPSTKEPLAARAIPVEKKELFFQISSRH